MTAPEMRALGIGEVLDRSFQVLRRHFGTLVTTALVGLAPLLVLYILMGVPYGATVSAAPSTGVAMMMLLMSLLMVVGMAVVWSGLTHQVNRAVEGGAVEVGDGLRSGLRSFFRVLGMGILVYLALLGLILPVGIIGGVVAAFAAGGAPGPLGAVLLFLAVAVPGVVAMVVWAALAFLILPTMVIEKVGPIKALRRANALAKGGRVRVCVTAFLTWLVVVLPSVGVPFLMGAGAALWDPMAAGSMGTIQLYLYQTVAFGVSAVTTPFMVAAMVFTYYDRRVRREGYDVELASASIPAAV
jgi:hypothetical protein